MDKQTIQPKQELPPPASMPVHSHKSIIAIVAIILIIIIGLGGFVITKVNHKNGSLFGDHSMQNQDGQGGTLAGWKNQCSGTGTVQMKNSPMNLSDVSIIDPIGLLAGAHVTPIDHLYFYPKDMQHRDAAPVFAIADGYIVDYENRGQQLHDGKADTGALRIVIQYSCSFYSYFDLLTSLNPAIAQKLESGDHHVAVKAGQEIGRVGAQSLDTAIYNLDLTLPGFVKPNSYVGEAWKIHTDDFFKYFDEPVRGQMLALNPRKVQPYGGKIDYDIAGKLQGNWFQEGTNGYAGPANIDRNQPIGDVGYFSGHLSIAPDAVKVQQYNISFGSYQGKPMQFTAIPGSLDPATVGVSSGAVKYEMTKYSQPSLQSSSLDQTIRGTGLFQVLENDTLKMEAFPGMTADLVKGFDGGEKTYTR